MCNDYRLERGIAAIIEDLESCNLNRAGRDRPVWDREMGSLDEGVGSVAESVWSVYDTDIYGQQRA